MSKNLLIIFSFFIVGNLAADIWWKNAVIYQVYPRSFKDTTGDGVGDLKGLTDQVNYLKELGVTAIWLNPIYPSGNQDNGYDVTNHKAIDSLFGTMDDFKKLVKSLHNAGIKIIMDFIPNHTSNKHEWFKSSRNSTSKNFKKYDKYYIWSKTKPNNWQNMFDGKSAWTLDKSRKQYYYHQFLSEQPDLNLRNSDVINELNDIAKFWLDLGVDGFRVDAVQHLFESKSLDSKEKPIPGCKDDTCPLIHTLTMNQKETFEWVETFSSYLNKNQKNDSAILFIAEVYLSVSTNVKTAMQYYGTDKKNGADLPLNSLFISTLNRQSSALDFKNNISSYLSHIPKNKTSNWVLGNHDNHRVYDRYGSGFVDGLNILNSFLPGVQFTYYGEEIGMHNVFIRFDQIQDRMAKAAGPNHYLEKTRDLERTPMQWNSNQNSGFSNISNTWLPISEDYFDNNQDLQSKHGQSHLDIYKTALKLRKEYENVQPNMMTDNNNYTLVLTKNTTKGCFLMFFNMNNLQAVIDMSNYKQYINDNSVVRLATSHLKLMRNDKPDPKAKLTLPAGSAIIFGPKVTGGATSLMSAVYLLILSVSLLFFK